MMSLNPVSILVAEDSSDDRRLLTRAFKDAGIANPVEFSHDGIDLLQALERCHDAKHLPGLIMMDLNMPRMDGCETLKAIRADARFKALPVLILTTSDSAKDVQTCYSCGANSVMIKPLDYKEFVALLSAIKLYWLNLVMLPRA